MGFIRAWLLGFVLLGMAWAQDAAVEQRNADVLRTLQRVLDLANQDLENSRRELQTADAPDRKRDLETQINAHAARVKELRQQFRDIAAGVDEATWQGKATPVGTMQDQVRELIEPVIGELREATADARELESLRKSLAEWQQRKATSEQALSRIDGLLTLTKEESLKRELSDARKVWTGRFDDAVGKIEVLGVQIAERTRSDVSLFDKFSQAIRRFWKSRGLNLVLAVATFVGAYFLIKQAWRRLRRYSPTHRAGYSSVAARLADLAMALAAVLFALFASLLMLYAKGDWFLLTIAAILLVGIAWASRAALPPYFEQIRLIINVGPVREGERLIVRGLPWRVDSLRMYSRLSNPALSGGLLRLPLRELRGLQSRPAHADEPWFPCNEGDWVRLTDGVRGKVLLQTPETVLVERPGGSVKSYPVDAFLRCNPEIISSGVRLQVRFAADIEHQAIAATAMPSAFASALREMLERELGADHVRNLIVEFAGSADMAIVFAITADLTGVSPAARNPHYRRLMRQTCLEVCNENGWSLPKSVGILRDAPAPRDA